MTALTKREELYCQGVARHGEKKKVLAYEEAGYSMNMSNAAIHVQADKLFNKPKMSLRIAELRVQVVKVAEEVFNITVEQRLRWLKEIVDAGLSTYSDQGGNNRRENLPASRGAIETMNSMLGVNEGDESNGEALSITFTVNEPIKDVKVTNGG